MTLTFKPTLVATIVGSAMIIAVNASAAPTATADFSFRDISSQSSRTPVGNFTTFSGGLWVDRNGDVDTRHNFGSNPDIQNPLGQGQSPLASFPDTGGTNDHVAAQWAFSVDSVTGNLSGIASSPNPVTVTAEWQSGIFGVNPNTGRVFGSRTPPIFFSHVFPNGNAFVNSQGMWIENNNSSATPGATLDPVSTYFDVDQGSGEGTFAFVANDPNDVTNLQTFLANQNTDAMFIGTGPDTFGTITATTSVPATSVPAPSALVLFGTGLVAFGFTALGRRRRDLAVARG